LQTKSLVDKYFLGEQYYQRGIFSAGVCVNQALTSDSNNSSKNFNILQSVSNIIIYLHTKICGQKVFWINIYGRGILSAGNIWRKGNISSHN